jgi:hypothetical protein
LVVVYLLDGDGFFVSQSPPTRAQHKRINKQQQTLGPRHAFAESRGLEGRLRATASRSDGAWDLRALADGSDAAFADALGASVNEYSGFRSTFEVCCGLFRDVGLRCERGMT